MAALLDRLARDLAAGRLVPYLGPGVSPDGGTGPRSTAALAERFAAKVALPKRVRGNLWASAQTIETSRHRRTVEAIMREAFAGPVEPGPLHRLLAELRVPLIVSAWYDRAMEAALGSRTDWGIVAGTSKHAVGALRWWTTRAPDGTVVADEVAAGWQTLLYKPHGCIEPDADMLISDSDYVEVLTEIDIQTPIPPEVKVRRQGRGFLMLGCRFDDQLLRTYARQILKRGGDEHFAVLPEPLTRGEERFLDAMGIHRIEAELGEVVAALTAVPA